MSKQVDIHSAINLQNKGVPQLDLGSSTISRHIT